MVDGHRELPLVNNVTSPVGGGWWRRWKGRLIYVVEAGLGSELGAVCVEEMWMKNDQVPMSVSGKTLLSSAEGSWWNTGYGGYGAPLCGTLLWVTRPEYIKLTAISSQPLSSIFFIF
jgi:hypothetical protein